MRKFLVIRSVTGRAREYAHKHFKRFAWFDDVKTAVAALKTGKRPWFVIVDGQGNDLGTMSRAAGLGYAVEVKGVP